MSHIPAVADGDMSAMIARLSREVAELTSRSRSVEDTGMNDAAEGRYSGVSISSSSGVDQDAFAETHGFCWLRPFSDYIEDVELAMEKNARSGGNPGSVASRKCLDDICSDSNFFNPSGVKLMSAAFRLQDPYSTSSSLVKSLDKPWKFSDILEARAQARAEDKLKRAISLSREENYKDAITSCSDSIALHPTADAYVTRGAAYANIGVLNLAVKDFKEALVLDPSHANASSYLAATLSKISALHVPASTLTADRDGRDDSARRLERDAGARSAADSATSDRENVSLIDRLQRDLDKRKSGRASLSEARRSRSESSASDSSSGDSISSSPSSSSSTDSVSATSSQVGDGRRSRSKSKRSHRDSRDGSPSSSARNEHTRSKSSKKRHSKSDKDDKKKTKKRKKDSKKEKKRKHKKEKRRRRSSSVDTSGARSSYVPRTEAGQVQIQIQDEQTDADMHPILQRKAHKLWG